MAVRAQALEHETRTFRVQIVGVIREVFANSNTSPCSKALCFRQLRLAPEQVELRVGGQRVERSLGPAESMLRTLLVLRDAATNRRGDVSHKCAW